MTKKHLLFALIVCMSTVWRFLELLEYGEIEVRQVDTYMYFYIRNSMTISKNSSTMSRTGSRTNMDGAISDSRRKPMMEELSNATRCPNEAERKKIS